MRPRNPFVLVLTALFLAGCSSAKEELHESDASSASRIGFVRLQRDGAQLLGKREPPRREMPMQVAAADFSTETGSIGADRERYDAIAENRFTSPLDDPRSTFSIDVDTASYSNVRRFLTHGQRPPRGAVRIEELINYFDYDYEPPSGDLPFSVTTELSQAPWNPDHQLLLVGLQAAALADQDVPPRNLVFLIDVSGSMQAPGKLSLVKRALRRLAGTLRREDSVAMAVYAGAAGVVLPPTPGGDGGRILAALERLEAGGSTNGGEGIRLAYALARRSFDPEAINRVLLATDGDFNVGITSRSDLLELIEREREAGIFLTVLGVGTDDLNDAGMEELADHGNGNYAYLDSLAEARKVLVAEAGSTLVTAAKDVKIQIEFNPRHVGAYRLIGYENRLLDARDFDDDAIDAGEIGAGHSVTALYEVVPVGLEHGVDTGTASGLRYQRGARETFGHRDELALVRLRYKAPLGDESELLEHGVPTAATGVADASDDLRFGAAVALFGMLLRDSAHTGSGDWPLVEELARGARGADPRGLRAGFLRLAVAARTLPEEHARAGSLR